MFGMNFFVTPPFRIPRKKIPRNLTYGGGNFKVVMQLGYPYPFEELTTMLLTYKTSPAIRAQHSRPKNAVKCSKGSLIFFYFAINLLWKRGR